MIMLNLSVTRYVDGEKVMATNGIKVENKLSIEIMRRARTRIADIIEKKP